MQGWVLGLGEWRSGTMEDPWAGPCIWVHGCWPEGWCCRGASLVLGSAGLELWSQGAAWCLVVALGWGPRARVCRSPPWDWTTGITWGPVNQSALGSLGKWVLTSLSFPHREGFSVHSGVHAAGGGMPGVTWNCLFYLLLESFLTLFKCYKPSPGILSFCSYFQEWRVVLTDVSGQRRALEIPFLPSWILLMSHPPHQFSWVFLIRVWLFLSVVLIFALP